MINTKSPNPIDVHVGARIRLRRMMVDMSQTVLGEHLGITFQQIQKYEKGTNRVGASRLQAIARVLEVEVAWFFEGAPGMKPIAGDQQFDEATPVTAFLSTSEGFRLNRAFLRITDVRQRRKIIELVAAMAGDEDEAAGPNLRVAAE